jgi:tetratricopeptide (TPR) repeat protein
MSESGAHRHPLAVTISQAMQYAAMAYTRGEWAEAKRLCRRILTVRGDCFEALNLLGIIVAQTHRTEEAASLRGRAVAANPDKATVHNNYGNVLKDSRLFEAALDSYESAAKLKPDYAEACYNRGNTLHDVNRFEDALDSHERALKLGDKQRTIAAAGDNCAALLTHRCVKD